MGRKLLHLLNGFITCAVVAALVIAGAYAGYALWDNQQIYDAAENVFSEMKEIRASLGMPTTVSALTELLEENRAAQKAQAEETEPAETVVPEASTDYAMMTLETLVPAESSTTEAANTPVYTASTEGISVPAEMVAANVDTTKEAVIVETAVPAATPVPTSTPSPTEEPVDDSLFGQLKAINKDINAWITLPGTAIDYPVLQGSSNYTYINTDVYGNFALAGSIFLDYRNSNDYTDLYNLLYGHNMAQHRMFSDINLYKDEEFFNKNTLGIMLIPDGNHILESLSVIVTTASDSGMHNPANWDYLDGEGILQRVQENAKFTCEKGLEALREKIDAGEKPRLISLSTCSDEFTDARTILLMLMDP